MNGLKPEMLVIPVAIAVSSQIDLSDYLIELQIGFAIVHALALFIYLFAYFKISSTHKAEEKKTIKLTSGEELNVREHDMKVLKAAAGQTLMIFVLIPVIHYYTGKTLPLFIQVTRTPVVLATSDVVSTYLFGQPPKPRPWDAANPAPSPFASLAAPKVDKKKNN
jgi:hypothetical protein